MCEHNRDSATTEPCIVQTNNTELQAGVALVKIDKILKHLSSVHYTNCRRALVFFCYVIDILFGVKSALTTYLFYYFYSPEILLYFILATDNKVEDVCEFTLRTVTSKIVYT